MFRTNKVCVILGRRNSGKTLYLIGNKIYNLVGLLNIYLKKGLKVLIIDTLDHGHYKNVPVMALNKLKYFTTGIARIFLPPDDIPKLAKYINSLPNMWNSLIVFEDAVKHTFKNVSKPLRELLIDSKQKNIDVVLMYHSWMQIPADLYNMIDFIECFKTNDSPKTRADSMPGYFETAFKIWSEVMADANQYAHKLIDATLC